MKTKFVVKTIGESYSGIEMTLIKYRKPEPPPPEPEPQPIIDPLEVFKPETDEEKVMLKIFKALKKIAPDLFAVYPRAPRRPVRLHVPPQEMKMPLTAEEYNNLGKPGLGQTLELDIEKVKEE